MDRHTDPTAAAQDVTLEVLRRLEAMTDLAGRLQAGADVGDVESCARALAEDADDVRRLVEHARDLLRIERGELPFKPSPVRLRDLMINLEDDWKERIRGAGLEFTVSYEGAPDQAALVDPERLRQLFDALIARARVETASGAISVTLRVQKGAESVTIEAGVRDSGRALSAAQLAHIFDPAQTTRPDSAASLSTRVGMALANRLVRAMSGVLQAEINESGGTSVAFSLMAPAVELDIPRAPHILIVDDNATNRLVAEALCEMFDCTSEPANDGIEALEAVQTRAFDLILMDIKMPRMDGIDATLAIRAMAGDVGRTPIVALTANAERADMRSYLEAGMNDVIEKPIKPARLAAVLQLLPVWTESAKTAAA